MHQLVEKELLMYFPVHRLGAHGWANWGLAANPTRGGKKRKPLLQSAVCLSPLPKTVSLM